MHHKIGFTERCPRKFWAPRADVLGGPQRCGRGSILAPKAACRLVGRHWLTFSPSGSLSRMRPFERFDIELFHLQHRLHGSLRFFGVRIAD